MARRHCKARTIVICFLKGRKKIHREAISVGVKAVDRGRNKKEKKKYYLPWTAFQSSQGKKSAQRGE